MQDWYTHLLTSCAGGSHNIPRTRQVDLLTLKVVSESRVTWATSMPILVFLGLSVIDLRPDMYATDRHQSDVRRASLLNAPGPRGGRIKRHRENILFPFC